MELFALYLWLRLDELRSLIVFVAATSLFSAALFVMIFCSEKPVYSTDDGHRSHTIRSWLPTRVSIVCCAVFLPLAVLVPSSKDAAILFGAHYAIKASESPEGAKVMSLLRRRVNEYLDDALTESNKGE